MRAVEMEVKEVAAWTKIIAAVLGYQNNHRGLSPTDEWVAIQTGFTRDLVRAQLRAMEKAGLLTDSKRWPRMIKINRDVAIDHIMDVVDPKLPTPAPVSQPAMVKPEDRREVIADIAKKHAAGGQKRWAGISKEERSRIMSEQTKKAWARRRAKAASQVETKEEEMQEVRGTEYVRDGKRIRTQAHSRMSFFERAKNIATIIDDFTDRTGQLPHGAFIRSKVGFCTSSGLTAVVTKMVEEGWLEHKPGYHADYKLTNLGRTTLLHAGPVEKVVQDCDPEQHKIDWPVKKEQPRKAPSEPRTAHPATERPPVVTIRGIVPERPPVPAYEHTAGYTGMATAPDLSGIDSLDLAMELQRRGWRVMR